MVSQALADLVDEFPVIGAFRLGAFQLKLHDKNPDAPLSPFYIDLRVIRSYPRILETTARVLGEIAGGLTFDVLVDVPTAATPIVAAMSIQMGKPMISPRLDAKTHGLARAIDGVYTLGQVALPVDDLVTTAASKIEAIKVLELAGLVVTDIVVLLDREQGGREELANAGYSLHAALTMTELLGYYVESRQITRAAYDICRKYLQGELPSGWEVVVEEGWNQPTD